MGKLGFVLVTLINYGLIYFAAYMTDTHGGEWLMCVFTRKDFAAHPFLTLGAAAILTWWGCGLKNFFFGSD